MNSSPLHPPRRTDSTLLSGFLAVNKPRGWTSFDVVAKIRNITGIRQIGHSGTLDPLAEGVLLIALGKVTRLLPYLIIRDKTYEVTVELGKESTTYDLEGKLTLHTVSAEPSREETEQALQEFIGEIEQTPPVFSAVKINGQRAYDMARKGQEVTMPKRKVRIDHIHILEYRFPYLRLEVGCGSGTYIRSLAHDLGKKLGSGGVVTELVRTRIDSLFLSECVLIEQLDPDGFRTYMLDTGRIADCMDMGIYTLSETEWDEMKHGRNIKILSPESLKEDQKDILCLYDDTIAAIARPSRKLETAQPLKVFA